MRLMLAFFLSCLFFAPSLQCDELEEGTVVIPAGEVFQGPYFALGDLVDISGIVEGDAFLIGTQVSVSGDVKGNLFVLAGSIEMTGKVRGNLWILAGGGAIAGEVEGDVNILAASVQLNSIGKIGKNLLVCAGNVDLDNQVGGDVTALASNLKVSGRIGHNMRSFAGKLRVTAQSQIEGDLNYKSNNAAWIDPKAQIGGTVHYKRSLLYDFLDIPVLKGLIIGSKVAAFLMNFIYTFVIGIVLIRMFPKKLKGALSALQDIPLKSFLYGLTLLVLLPIASLLLLATVIGAPFALTLIALNIVSFYTVKIFVILWAVNWLFSYRKWKKNTVLALLTGQVIYCILTAIPVIGPFVAAFCMVLGLGAGAVSQTR